MDHLDKYADSEEHLSPERKLDGLLMEHVLGAEKHRKPVYRSQGKDNKGNSIIICEGLRTMYTLPGIDTYYTLLPTGNCDRVPEFTRNWNEMARLMKKLTKTYGYEFKIEYDEIASNVEVSYTYNRNGFYTGPKHFPRRETAKGTAIDTPLAMAIAIARTYEIEFPEGSG